MIGCVTEDHTATIYPAQFHCRHGNGTDCIGPLSLWERAGGEGYELAATCRSSFGGCVPEVGPEVQSWGIPLTLSLSQRERERPTDVLCVRGSGRQIPSYITSACHVPSYITPT